jgi:hypothetical protein
MWRALTIYQAEKNFISKAPGMDTIWDIEIEGQVSQWAKTSTTDPTSTPVVIESYP